MLEVCGEAVQHDIRNNFPEKNRNGILDLRGPLRGDCSTHLQYRIGVVLPRG